MNVLLFFRPYTPLFCYGVVQNYYDTQYYSIRSNTLRQALNLAPLPKGAGLRQGSLLSNLVISGDTCDIQTALTLSAAKTEGSLATNCFSPAVASVNNPSVTVTEILFIYKKSST